MIAAAVIFAAAAVIFGPGVVRILRGDQIDRLVAEALDGPDYEANVNARWQG